MANSITYNSVDLGGGSYGFTVESAPFLGAAQPRVVRDRLASADGELTQGATFEARVGEVSGVVVATSYANLLTQQANIFAALRAGQEGVKALTFDARSGKSWNARVLSVNWTEETAATARLSITFLAPDPWSIATSSTNTNDSIDGSGTTTI